MKRIRTAGPRPVGPGARPGWLPAGAAVFMAALATASTAPPTEYEIDPAHSRVEFRVRHLGISTVTGHFNRFSGRFAFDPENPADSWVRVTVEAASIDTGHERRDNHLRSADFLDANGYPEMTFQSRRVERVDEGRYRIEGDLTIRGVTRAVVLDAAQEGETVAGGGRPVVAWSAETAIDRTDYGLTWNRLTEAGGLLVGEEVRIRLEVEARGAAGS